MGEVSVRTSRTLEDPAVLFKQADDLADLHWHEATVGRGSDGIRVGSTPSATAPACSQLWLLAESDIVRSGTRLVPIMPKVSAEGGVLGLIDSSFPSAGGCQQAWPGVSCGGP